MRLNATPANRCQECGEHVASHFTRVYGDDDGVAHRCLECDTRGRLARGSAAGRSTDRPDPLEARAEHGKSREDIPRQLRARTEGGQDD